LKKMKKFLKYCFDMFFWREIIEKAHPSHEKWSLKRKKTVALT